MQFKINNTSYKICFSFFAVILLALSTDKGKTLLLILLFAGLHEAVHLIFIYSLSDPPKSVSLSLLGANISRGTNSTTSLNSEILINISAPVFNIAAGAFFQLLSVKTEEYSALFSEFALINFVIGLFNLIPFYTFDGGNALKYFLLKLCNEKVTEQITTAISLAVTVLFSFASIYIFLNYSHNFSLLIMCAYMFIAIIFKKQNSLDYY